ncbi:MAG: DMT family transporter [Candidatus Aminicenantes bacterium]|nr:DMT family transporter [Candidatus Aminicenantes bacterium]
MTGIYGEIAALLTAVCWTFNSVVFTRAGQRVGAVTVNAVRLWVALPALVLLNGLLFGTPFPFAIEADRFLYLGVSGVVGFVLGDAMLFESFLLIGPRLAMLMALLVPVFGAFLAWTFLGERLLALEIVSILVTIGGVAWVVAEETAPLAVSPSRQPRKFGLGILLAVGGALGQAVGLLFSRLGLAGGYSAVTATLVRVAVAGAVMAGVGLLQGRLRVHLHRMSDRKALLEITAGALTGPVLGVVLSLVAIAHTHIGVASTLMSLTPVMLLPVSHSLFKERITVRAVFGTTVALLGVVMLFVL